MRRRRRKPIEGIADIDLLTTIKKDIGNLGAYIAEGKDPTIDMERGYVYTTEAWLHTIGRHSYGQPEILMFCGPALTQHPINVELMTDIIASAKQLMQSIVDQWLTYPIYNGRIFDDEHGRRYYVTTVRISVSTLKKKYTGLATSYYRSNRYKLIVLVPIYEGENSAEK